MTDRFESDPSSMDAVSSNPSPSLKKDKSTSNMSDEVKTSPTDRSTEQVDKKEILTVPKQAATTEKSSVSEQKPRIGKRRTISPRRQSTREEKDTKPTVSASETSSTVVKEPTKPAETIYLSDLKQKKHPQLVTLAESMGIEKVNRAKAQDIIFSLLKAYAKRGDRIICEGVFDKGTHQNSGKNSGYKQGGFKQGQEADFGFLRSHRASYAPGPDDIYISSHLARRMQLKKGDTVEGVVREPREGERYFALSHINKINGKEPNQRNKVNFESLTPLFPNEMLHLERADGTESDISMRALELLAPIGKGQRGLIVSPPKAGKTLLLQNIAHSITHNHPEVELIVLLIDERPEEVTEMARTVKGEVVASTFDESAARHVHVAEMVAAKAKRLVEERKDVVILLDSITRLARAYNTMTPASGKILTGGVDANALQRPKRFFGSARNLEEGGSLTIIATALIETGSKMDEVIYEEFKGTGNMELHLSRQIAQRHIYPAMHVNASGTRREELIVGEEALKRLWILRKYLGTMDDVQAIEFLVERLKKSKTNEAFFKSMKGG